MAMKMAGGGAASEHQISEAKKIEKDTASNQALVFLKEGNY